MYGELGKPPSNVETLVSLVRGHGATIAPGTIVGAGVYISTGRFWQALVLACLVGPPTRAAQKVAAEWIELLRPPKRWRRPRRRGT
jgi:hypothetical protein